MPNWLSLYQQHHVIEPDVYPYFLSGSIKVPDGVKQMRIRCQLHQTDTGTNEQIIKQTVQQYFSQFEVNNEQLELIQDFVYQEAFRISKSGWSIQLFDADYLFRGRWDSSFQGWKEWTECNADEGFVAGPFPHGKWQYLICVYSHDIPAMDVRIEIETSIEPGQVPLFVPFDLSCEVALQQTEPRWYAGELQESTTRSNGKLHVQDTVDVFQSLGYSFLGLSDIDMQPLSALPQQPQLGIIRGQILPTTYGYINALGVNHFLQWHQQQHPIPISNVIYEIHAQGGLVNKMNPFALREQHAVSGLLPWEHIDMLQIWEGFWEQHFPEITKAFDLWDQLLNQDIRITGVCGKGSDIEVNARNVESLPKLLVHSTGQSEAELLNAIKLGKCYSTVEQGIDFWVESEFGGILTGDELQLPDGEVFTLRLDITGAGERCFFRIKTNDGLFCEMPLMAKKDPVQMRFTDYAEPKVRWYRVELYRYGRPIDELLAFSNPLYIRGLVSMR